MERSMIVTEVYCSLRIEGIHHWPKCPHREVEYLRDPHRHMFHIKAWVNVSHDDRDVEFIMLKHQIDEYLVGKYAKTDLPTSRWVCDFGAMSCEMIARELLDRFGLSRCEVSEDGENGAIVSIQETRFE